MLRKIQCFLRPTITDLESTDIFDDEQAKEIQKRLMELEVPGMTISRAVGFGRRSETNEKGDIPLEKRLKIEIVLEESKLEAVIDELKDLAGAGEVGAGKIFVMPVEDAIRISTEETGRSALY